MNLRGWILDVYPEREGMAVWVITDGEERLKLVEPWRPRAYASCAPREAEAMRRWFDRRGVRAGVRRAFGRDFMSGREIPVFELSIGDAEAFSRLMAGLRAQFPSAEFFNADIPVDRLWFYETGRFPLARVEISAEGGLIRGMSCIDSIWDVDYELPPFSTLGLRLEGASVNPAHGVRLPAGFGEERGGIEVHTGDDVRVLSAADGGELLERLNALIFEHDPDIIVTEYGESFILPRLSYLSERTGVELRLNRDHGRKPRVSPSRSYFSYGRIVHRDETWMLYGRIHVDRRNSFVLDATAFDGLFEASRLCRLPVQVCARTSTGTGISAMQVAQAVSEGILVPVDKSQTEVFKEAGELLDVDKGGLVYQPEPGLHEWVGELDFASMYPSIMVRHNLSPETMGCACCALDGEKVPETGTHSCVRREGLVPKVLTPLLAKRARFKELGRSAATESVRRRAVNCASLHKWLLVCSFGYLGYRNARFGRIEAHEATTAWGREALLRAKETAENMGYRFLHAIVDSMWVEPAGGGKMSAGELESLARAVEKASGLPVGVEGVYRWVAFLPSKEDACRGVANRYMGVFESGEVKMRGVESRRRDTPSFVASEQEEMVRELALAPDAGAAVGVADSLAVRLREKVREVCEGRMSARELTIYRNISKAPADYSRSTPAAVAAQQLASRGVRLEPGEKIAYVLGSDRPFAVQVMPDGMPYDSRWYADCLIKASATVLGPFGWSYERLSALCSDLIGPAVPSGKSKGRRTASREAAESPQLTLRL